MFEIYGITDKGKVREKNEDAYLIDYEVINKKEFFMEKTKEIFVAIADGMGGHDGGEIASKLVLENLKNSNLSFEEENINNIINDINNKIFEYSSKSNKVGIGSTLVGIKALEDQNVIVNVGDSRLYLFRNGFIRQLTRDQTLVQQYYECGLIDRDEIKNHHKSHILTQCIGGSKKELIKAQIILNKKLKLGDILILCSDGLYNKVDDDSLESVLKENKNIRNMGQTLIEIANDLGGEDNVTVIIIKVI